MPRRKFRRCRSDRV